MVSSRCYYVSVQFRTFLILGLTSRSVGTLAIQYSVHILHSFILFLLLFSIELGVEAGGCICVLLYVFVEYGIGREVRHWRLHIRMLLIVA